MEYFVLSKNLWGRSYKTANFRAELVRSIEVAQSYGQYAWSEVIHFNSGNDLLTNLGQLVC